MKNIFDIVNPKMFNVFMGKDKRNLILKINDFYSNLEWFHYGDDAGGVNIFLDLVHKTQIPFQENKMDIDNLLKYKNEC